MLTWLYDLMMTIVSFVLGLFGLNTKKHVHFEDEDAKDDTSEQHEDNTTEVSSASPAQEPTDAS